MVLTAGREGNEESYRLCTVYTLTVVSSNVRLEANNLQRGHGGRKHTTHESQCRLPYKKQASGFKVLIGPKHTTEAYPVCCLNRPP